MAKIPLTLQNAGSSYAISVKMDGDTTERYQSFSDGFCYFAAPTDSTTHNYQLKVTAGACSTSQNFALYCASAQTCKPPVNYYQFATRRDTKDAACAVVCSGNVGNEGGHPVDYLGVGGKVFDNYINCDVWNNTGWFPVHKEVGDPFTQVVRLDAGIIQELSTCSCSGNTQPGFTLSAKQPTCSDQSAQLLLTGIVNANRYFVAEGSSYTGNTNCAQATQFTSVNNSYSIDVATPAAGTSVTYTVRVYNGTDCSQWWDQSVTLQAPVCSGTVQPVTLSVQNPTCSGSSVSSGRLFISGATDNSTFRYCYGSSFTCNSDCSSPDGYLPSGSAAYDLSFPARSTSYTQDITVRVYKPGCTGFTDYTTSFSIPACTSNCVPSSASLDASASGNKEVKTYSYTNTNCSDQTIYVWFDPDQIPDQLSLKIGSTQIYTTGCTGNYQKTAVSVVLRAKETITIEVDGTCYANQTPPGLPPPNYTTVWYLKMNSTGEQYGGISYTPISR